MIWRKQYGREWHQWYHARYRCQHPNKYPHYAHVKFDPRWNFEQFLKDMGKCPTDYTLDRIDPWGDYTAANCRWANRSTQRRNQRHCLNRNEYYHWFDVAAQNGITGDCFRSRISRLGYTPKQAALTPKLYRGATGRCKKIVIG